MRNVENREHLQEIAVIGMAGSFPGAKNLDEFWENLSHGVESISFFTADELTVSGIDPAIIAAPNYVKAGGVLDDVEMFDASVFDVSPRIAALMDPQYRFFLEKSWEALENSGYFSEEFAGVIGVYGGMGMSKYLLNNILPNRDLIELEGSFQLRILNDKDFLASLTAYKLNLKGPALTVQTACSTSLVAVWMACQSLLNYQCDLCLAGGVCIESPVKGGYFYQEGLFSSDGHCRAFDSSATGTVSGNGVGVIVLKRLEDAVNDGDFIHAVIKGSAINNDGAVKVGYTAPSVDGQSEVIALAQGLAGVDPETITYIEAHGTATPLGDPIEIAALTRVFRAATGKKHFCGIGSVKTNIGHLDAAAGVAGLIKTILALKHKRLPPSLHFKQPNPAIDFADSPFYVNSELSEWETDQIPRRAGVSSFAIGGVNAHVVVEEAPEKAKSGPGRPLHLLTLSAKTDSGLKTATDNLIAYLKKNPKQNFADIVFTLQVGRKGFDHRRVLLCRDSQDAVTALEKSDSDRVWTGIRQISGRSVTLMFSGWGEPDFVLGKELYRIEPEFRDQMDRCFELLFPYTKSDLRDYFDPRRNRDTNGNSVVVNPRLFERLCESIDAGPALFILQYALAQLWIKWGVKPQAMIGYGIGEMVAACLSGVLSLEKALMMIAQGASLTRNPADHSKFMTSAKSGITDLFSSVKLSAPKIPFISGTTGTWITHTQATNPSYWAEQLCQPFRFDAGIDRLLKTPGQILLEIGSDRTLSDFVLKNQADKNNPIEYLILPSPDHSVEPESILEYLLGTLGKLWLAGGQVSWSGYYSRENRHRVPLPTYPFEKKPYWIESRPEKFRRLDAVIDSGRADLLEVKSLENKKHPRPNLATQYAAPNNELEIKVAEIWQEVLWLEQVGVYDNYFDLGGDSLLAAQLIARLNEHFDLNLSLEQLFAGPTVAELVVNIVGRQAEQLERDLVAQAIVEIKQLSNEELQVLLAAERQADSSR